MEYNGFDMEKIPNIIKERIILDCIILQKRIYVWYNINNYLKYFDLHLKKTDNIKYFDIEYSKIKRVLSLCFVNKPYTWLKKSFPYSKLYYYRKPELVTINDLFSIDDDGIYFDDYDSYDDYSYDDNFDD